MKSEGMCIYTYNQKIYIHKKTYIYICYISSSVPMYRFYVHLKPKKGGPSRKKNKNGWWNFQTSKEFRKDLDKLLYNFQTWMFRVFGGALFPYNHHIWGVVAIICLDEWIIKQFRVTNRGLAATERSMKWISVSSKICWKWKSCLFEGMHICY